MLQLLEGAQHEGAGHLLAVVHQVVGVVERACAQVAGVGRRAHALVVEWAAGAALAGAPLSDETMRAAAEACYLRARPLDNTDHLMNYRKQMARPFVLRALEELRQAV